MELFEILQDVENRGITQGQFAEISGVSQATISRIAAKKFGGRVDTFKKIKAAYKIIKQKKK